MNHRRGLSDNISRSSGFRVLLIENWAHGPGCFDLHIQEVRDGRTYTAKPVELEFVEKKETAYGPIGDPFLKIRDPAPIEGSEGALLQALERAFKPKHELDQGGIKAMNRHLQDMRALVFKKTPTE